MSDPSSQLRENSGHSRAGNGMGRSRKALLDGARRAIAANGLSATSMVDVADYGQVARATLYNHFRSKDDLWAALVLDEMERVSGLFRAEANFAAGLKVLAQEISANPMLRTIAKTDPSTLAALTRVDDGALWLQIQARFVLLAKERKISDSAAVDLAFRWLLSQVGYPLAEIASGSAAMIAGITRAPAVLF
ncbi:MAG TPA: helix-turn-helix domain-containing protein [Candidatus Nanopelagicaceae bacterium]|nr:helix-turn-helix domain-containing protein [Candidatus Nanopelagicaceae bacterium]